MVIQDLVGKLFKGCIRQLWILTKRVPFYSLDSC